MLKNTLAKFKNLVHTTHKNKIRHTQKQNGTTTHTNKKTLLKIQTQTKQTRKTTHKKLLLLFIYRKKWTLDKLTN